MGRDVPALVFTREDRRRYRIKMQECLDAFSQMLRESRFDVERPRVGLEIELNLTDTEGEPTMRNADVLAAIADPAWDTELGRFNLEINVPPRRLIAGGPDAWEEEIRAALNHADERARTIGVHLIMIGILPTLRETDVGPDALSENARYQLINEQVFAARGEDLLIEVDGVDRLRTYADTITPEAACTSTQFHLQVSPEEFADYWNAAQAIAGVQVALAANSPFLFGKELAHETRIPLFEQATDTRPQEIKAQGVRPRVWFGERWITSVFDLFEENLRYFPAAAPVRGPGPHADAGPRGHTGAVRTHPAQRDDLPVEPSGLRRRRGQTAPESGEPRAARGPDGRRHPRQRCLLLRSHPRPGGGGPAGVVADVLLGRRGQPARRGPERHRRPALLAGNG